MSSHGKTVRIYLADGSPTGIRHAEVVNWTGQAIVCPRGRIGELGNWKEAKRPGVYILIGDDPDHSQKLAYVGEAENVLERLKSHVAKKDFWDQVVFFTSKDDNLTKAHVKYLESRVIELAAEAQRIYLENGTKPPLPSLPRSDQDSMEEFLEPTRILLGALGFTILEPIRSSRIHQTNGEIETSRTAGNLESVQLSYEKKKRGVNAQGVVTDEGFVVLEGAVGPAEFVKSARPAVKSNRQNLINEEAIEIVGNHIRFTRDVLFTSPSKAASVLYGGEVNGRTAWKDKDGSTLRDLENTLIGTNDEAEEE